MKLDRKTKLLLVVVGLAFLISNALLLLIADILSLNLLAPSIIISWVFMLLGFAAFLLFAKMSSSNPGMANARFLGITIIKYCIIYLVVDLLFAILTMVLSAFVELDWVWNLLIQAIVFLVYAAFIVLCIAAKEEIQSVGAKIENKTSFMRMIKADAAMLPEYCGDANAKAIFVEFAEAVKYSDPVSSDALQDVEERLSDIIGKIKIELSENDIEKATADCKTAMLILKERNLKCKMTKPRN